jgi:hypothetical protein
LVTALRESCGYLRDGGYHQTAQLMDMAAEEIERLSRRVHALEAGNPARPRAEDHLRKIIEETTTQKSQGRRDGRLHHGK